MLDIYVLDFASKNKKTTTVADAGYGSRDLLFFQPIFHRLC